MTVYLVEYTDYFRGLQVSDFETMEALDAHMTKKEPDWPKFLKNPAASAHAVVDTGELHMGSRFRRDLFNMLLAEGEKPREDKVTPQQLLMRIELFMKEE